ncbi:hypothetical protein FBQ82_16180 [Anaerolineae bacterium CFX7]|nr:hypothetical protein [Anaerolineae bacterium CFX7]
MQVKSQIEPQTWSHTAPSARAASRRWARFSPALAPLALILLTLLVVWQYNPLTRTLTGDHGTFAYLSQLVADGFMPHQYAFNEQASLTFFIGGAFMRLGDIFGVHRLLALRAASVGVFAIIVGLTYLLTLRWTRSQWAAFVAGAILIGFEAFGVRAATGLEPKALMLAFGLGALLALQKHQWFWAGALAGLAGLAWQIAWGYLIVALLLAFVQGGATPRARTRAVLQTLAPALVILAAYCIVFAAHGAFIEMVQQTFLAPALMHEIGSRPFAGRVRQLYNTFVIGYRSHLLFAALGIGGFVIWLLAHLRPWRVRALPARGAYYFFANRRTAGVLLVVAGFTLYSFLDFQNYPDWFPLLPFLALFAAWLVWQAAARVLQFLNLAPRARTVGFAGIAALLGLVSVSHAFLAPPLEKQMQGLTWQDQARAAATLSRALGPETSVWVIGKPELLFMMQRRNLNPYIYLFGNVDGIIDRLEPGGFSKMLADARAQKPGLVVMARLPKNKFTAFANYRALEEIKTEFMPVRQCRALGAGSFFVPRDNAASLFAAAQGCIKK